MKKEAALRYVGFNVNDDREKDDFYPTPSEATQALLDRQKFTGNILEPACGDGAMSKVLISNGYEVISSDLFDRGYGKTGVNFLETTEKVDNVITNPPFKLATEFTVHSLKLARHKVVMLSKITYLEGIRRKKLIFDQKKLQTVLILKPFYSSFACLINLVYWNYSDNKLMSDSYQVYALQSFLNFVIYLSA